MMRQCQLPTCGKWFEPTNNNQRHCPGECQEQGRVLAKQRESKQRGESIKSTTKGRNAGKRNKHDSDIVAREQTAFIPKDDVHTPSDIMHAPAEKAFRMLDRILSGRDLFTT